MNTRIIEVSAITDSVEELLSEMGNEWLITPSEWAENAIQAMTEAEGDREPFRIRIDSIRNLGLSGFDLPEMFKKKGVETLASKKAGLLTPFRAFLGCSRYWLSDFKMVWFLHNPIVVKPYQFIFGMKMTEYGFELNAVSTVNTEPVSQSSHVAVLDLS